MGVVRKMLEREERVLDSWCTEAPEAVCISERLGEDGANDLGRERIGTEKRELYILYTKHVAPEEARKG